MITTVILSKRAQKDILKVPLYIRDSLHEWISSIELVGINEVRKIPGFHDEPLKGTRHGQRSIRINRAYRAIYVIKENGYIEFIEVIEVNKHEY